MTFKEQIMKLQTYKMFENEDTVYVERDDVLKLLEQQPYEDCISRESIIEWLKDKDIIKTKNQEENARRELAELPFVTPQRKRGKWIAPNTSPSLMMMGIRLCSECNYETQEAGKFCTNCGAEMESDTDDNMDASNNG